MLNENYMESKLSFGFDDIESILKQLANSNRMLLPFGLRGMHAISFKCYFHLDNQIFHILVSNDERRKIIKNLKSIITI